MFRGGVRQAAPASEKDREPRAARREIPINDHKAKGSTGYSPRQPLARLARVGKASCNEGDPAPDPAGGRGTPRMPLVDPGAAGQETTCRRAGWIGSGRSAREVRGCRSRASRPGSFPLGNHPGRSRARLMPRARSGTMAIAGCQVGPPASQPAPRSMSACPASDSRPSASRPPASASRAGCEAPPELPAP